MNAEICKWIVWHSYRGSAWVSCLLYRYQRFAFRHKLYQLREERNIRPETFASLVSALLYEKRWVEIGSISCIIYLLVSYLVMSPIWCVLSLYTKLHRTQCCVKEVYCSLTSVWKLSMFFVNCIIIYEKLLFLYLVICPIRLNSHHPQIKKSQIRMLWGSKKFTWSSPQFGSLLCLLLNVLQSMRKQLLCDLSNVDFFVKERWS